MLIAMLSILVLLLLALLVLLASKAAVRREPIFEGVFLYVASLPAAIAFVGLFNKLVAPWAGFAVRLRAAEAWQMSWTQILLSIAAAYGISRLGSVIDSTLVRLGRSPRFASFFHAVSRFDR